MGTLTKRCAVCGNPVPPASIFCSSLCKEVGHVIRNAQPALDERHARAVPVETPDDRDELVAVLSENATHHRARMTMIIAAYARAEAELNAIIWAAYARGVPERDISRALEMRTSSVRRRILDFQAALHGPVNAAG